MDLVDQKACKFLHKIDELRPQCSCSRTGPTSYPSFLQSLALSSSVFVLIRKAQGLSWPHFWFSAVCRTRPVSLINAIGRTIPFGSFLFVILHLDGLYLIRLIEQIVSRQNSFPVFKTKYVSVLVQYVFVHILDVCHPTNLVREKK